MSFQASLLPQKGTVSKRPEPNLNLAKSSQQQPDQMIRQSPHTSFYIDKKGASYKRGGFQTRKKHTMESIEEEDEGPHHGAGGHTYVSVTPTPPKTEGKVALRNERQSLKES